MELSLVEGKQHRNFSEIVWQIAERNGCNEIVVRYDCGHSLRAEVVASSFPSAKEYGSQECERRRYAQHCLHVLTRNPNVAQVRVTVAEGRCRHCQRGQRQTLVCGPVHVDLREPASPGLVAKALGSIRVEALAQAKRLELPMTGHAFLATLGQVCQLPGSGELRAPSGAREAALELPFAQATEEVRQWTRKEVEDELESQLMRYVCCATMVFLLILAECCYSLSLQLLQEPLPKVEGASFASVLANTSTVSNLELRMANSSRVLSALTVQVHQALAPSDESSGGFLWSLIHPVWVALLLLWGPLSWLDGIVAVPRSLILMLLGWFRELLWRPGAFILGMAGSALIFLLKCLFSPPTLFVTRPTSNPMLGAALICAALVAITSPVPLTLLAHDLGGVVANLDLMRRLRRAAAGNKALNQLMDRIHTPRPKGRAKKELRPREKGEKLQAKDEKALAPACFVCLDKPSRYVLEPCGHRVVCGDCAVQLVDAATRSRAEGTERGDRGGSNCPSCGSAITRAMRIFI